MRGWLWVALGSALGGGLRFVLGDAALRLWVVTFPWPTLVVNTAGACLIGWLAASLPRLPRSQAFLMRHFAMTGLCGGFTTFSLFSLETLELWHREPVLGACYLAATLVLSLIAVTVGHVWGNRR